MPHYDTGVVFPPLTPDIPSITGDSVNVGAFGRSVLGPLEHQLHTGTHCQCRVRTHARSSGVVCCDHRYGQDRSQASGVLLSAV